MAPCPCAPDVILLRGAPAIGKSTAALGCLEALGRGAVVEVDHFRASQARCNWQDRRQHAIALAVAVECVRAFADEGTVPIVLVDTFGRTLLPGVQAQFDAVRLSHTTFSLWVESCELRARARRRGAPAGQDEMSGLLNDEVHRVRWARESLIDTTQLEPAAVVRLILAESGWRGARECGLKSGSVAGLSRSPERSA